MKLREIGGDLAQLIISSEQAVPRAPGIHVSDVIKYLRDTIGKNAKWEDHPLETSAQLGRIWETVVARLLAVSASDPEHIVRPGQVECDGIIGSPDGIDLESSAVIEYKCTWRSSANRIEVDFPYYLWQIKSYCHMCSCKMARLFVLFINGSYKGTGPIVKGWEMEFNSTELKSNWDMILKAAKEMPR